MSLGVCSGEDASKCSWCSVANSGFVRKLLRKFPSESFIREYLGQCSLIMFGVSSERSKLFVRVGL